MDTIFTVKNDDLERLGPQEAVDFFRELLWAEGRRVGIAISKIHVSSWINVPDGGIDAFVEENDLSTDIIRPGYTGYQIKAGASFEPWQDAEIKKELFGRKYPSKENLGSSIRDCLDKDGTYILVCFKQDLNAEQHRQAAGTLEHYFKQCGYSAPKVLVLSQSNVIGFLKLFPSLALEVARRGPLKFQTHKSWSQEAEMKKEFEAGQKQCDFIGKMQHELRKNDEAIHIHVWGEAGIGKTKLVLEATRTEDIKPLVVYCDSAVKFRDSDLMNEILREDNQFHTLLVIDECDPDSRSYIWNKLKHCGPRIKFISIYNEFDNAAGNISYVDVPALEEDQISSIIQSYAIPKDQAGRWAELCSGSPRYAHVIGWNLKNNPEDLLKPPDTVNVWDRHIVGGDRDNSDGVQQRKLLLRHIALFRRFGYGQPVISEAQCVAKIIQQADPRITWPRFQEIIRDLRSRKILQGETTIYITPKALHIKLWIDWWEIYGNSFNHEEFCKQWTPQLVNWFYEMFKYASESKVAQRTVRELLSEKGPFRGGDYLKTKLGARFFLALTEANPASALVCLQKTIGTCNKDELLHFTTGRRDVVWALERIAIWRPLFADAARLVLALGEAENETWGNNASGIFAQLFSPAYGQVAPTEAPPEERFPILKEALESSAKARRLLALQACDQALESEHFVRTSGAERQGLRKEPQLWMPKTWGDLFNAYRRVWGVLRERVDGMPEDEQQKAVSILIQNARGLLRYKALADMVLDTLEELSSKTFVSKKDLMAKIVQILHYERKELPQETYERLENLKNLLTGSDFGSLMRRYVGMDLFEDKFDEEGHNVDQTELRIDTLAQEALNSQDVFKQELKWLVTADARNGFRFGYMLGKRDNNCSLLPTLLEAQSNASEQGIAYFLGGYFRAIHENDPQKWEEQLDSAAEDAILRVLVPELTWRSGMSDQAALRILNLAEKGAINVGHFRMFGAGSVIRDLSERVFTGWLNFLLASRDREGLSIAMDLHHFYYLNKESKHSLPEDLTLKLLTHDVLFQKIERFKGHQMDDYEWTEIGKALIECYPGRSLELAAKFLQHFGEDGTIVEGFHSSTHEVLNEITRCFPDKIWQMVTNYLGPPIDSRAFHIKNWLRGGEFFAAKEGALVLMPPDQVWKWADEDIEERASYLASFVPKSLFREPSKMCWAREVLARYGDRKDVREELMANFSTEGSWGPASLHYQQKKRQLLAFKENEENENVRRWIDDYAKSLDWQIEQARIEEERRGF